MNKFTAPGGLEIFHNSIAEAKYIYSEVFEHRVYFRHGISLDRGGTVFDIGANIGIFTMFIRENFPQTTVHAFEPSPQNFEALCANTKKYGPSVRPQKCGVGKSPGEAVLTFYPQCSMMSTLHSNAANEQQILRAGILGALKEKGVTEVPEHLLQPMVDKVLQAKQEYTVPICTISDAIEAGGLNEVALIKIDTEGSELDVLQGIRADHWGLIGQFVIEAHSDADRRSIVEILEARGFKCTVEQEGRLSGAELFNCYAKR